jgi:flagellar protein FliS
MACASGSRAAASAYAEQEILAESPLARVGRLYDMAGLEISRARAAIAAGDLQAKGRAVDRALRCISVLHASLDMQAGGEVARNLDRLYAYMLRRIVEASLRNDEAPLLEIAGHLSELGSAWRSIA